MDIAIRQVVAAIKTARRRLLHAPLISCVAILTLGAGSGLVTTIWGLFDSLNWRPLPYLAANRTVALTFSTQRRAVAFSSVPVDMADYIRRNATSFELITSFRGSREIADIDGEQSPLAIGEVDTSFLPMLGARLIVGRWPDPAELERRDHIIVVSSDFVESHLTDASRAIGRVIKLRGDRYTIVGVADGRALLPDRAAGWIPIDHAEGQATSPQPVQLLARLRPGVPRHSATEEMTRLSQSLKEAYPGYSDAQIIVQPEMVDRSLSVRGSVADLVIGLTVMVLLITCFNISALLMLRSGQTQGELAIRMMVGASSQRVALEVFLEISIIAASAGTLGTIFAHTAMRLVNSLLPVGVLPSWVSLGVSGRALAVVILGVIAIAICVGWFPARLAARTSLLSIANAGGMTSTRPGHVVWLARRLLFFQVSAAVVLSSGAILMAQSYRRLTKVNFGYAADSICSIRLNFDGTGYSSADLRTRGAIGIAQALTAYSLNGEAAVRGPIHNFITIPARVTEQSTQVDPTRIFVNGDTMTAALNRFYPPPRVFVVSSSYFNVLRLPILSGRSFNDRDAPGPQGAAIVSARFAKEVWGQSPLGRNLQIGAHTQPLAVVGVAADVRDLQSGSRGLSSDARADVYLPATQAATDAPQVLMRDRCNAMEMKGRIDSAMQAIGFVVPFDVPRTLLRVIDGDMRAVRSVGVLLGIFATSAVVLSAIGVYAVVRISISAREREIGIRSALGCSPSVLIIKMLARELGFVAAGVGTGALISWLLPRVLAPFIFGAATSVGMWAPPIALLFLVSAGIASLLPARRLAFAEPAHLLRQL